MVCGVGELIASGELEDVRGVTASARTAALAGEVGVPLVTLADVRPAVTIDGADEIGPGLASPGQRPPSRFSTGRIMTYVQTNSVLNFYSSL